jgi:hypothetical protein
MLKVRETGFRPLDGEEYYYIVDSYSGIHLGKGKYFKKKITYDNPNTGETDDCYEERLGSVKAQSLKYPVVFNTEISAYNYHRTALLFAIKGVETQIAMIEDKKKRDSYNKKIISLITTYAEKHPQLRFGQLLWSMGILPFTGIEDGFYEESTETYERIMTTAQKEEDESSDGKCESETYDFPF